MPVDVVTADRSGRLGLGALATLVDLTCARVALGTAHPHWIATADLSIQTTDRPTGGTATVEVRLLRAGSKLIVLDVDLHGMGSGVATFVRIPSSASEVVRPQQVIGERMGMAPLGPPPTMPIGEKMALAVVDGGVELARTDYVRNSFGTINGGVMGFLVCAAAEEATGLVAADLLLRYVGQTKVGPARAVATVVRTAADHAVCEVRVVDAGADGLTLARATVTLLPA
jgi:acyl-coenzyme A thioesterase PaaI-like protein